MTSSIGVEAIEDTASDKLDQICVVAYPAIPAPSFVLICLSDLAVSGSIMPMTLRRFPNALESTCPN